jgi:hypothetical protein
MAWHGMAPGAPPWCSGPRYIARTVLCRSMANAWPQDLPASSLGRGQHTVRTSSTLARFACLSQQVLKDSATMYASENWVAGVVMLLLAAAAFVTCRVLGMRQRWHILSHTRACFTNDDACSAKAISLLLCSCLCHLRCSPGCRRPLRPVWCLLPHVGGC